MGVRTGGRAPRQGCDQGALTAQESPLRIQHRPHRCANGVGLLLRCANDLLGGALGGGYHVCGVRVVGQHGLQLGGDLDRSLSSLS